MKRLLFLTGLAFVLINSCTKDKGALTVIDNGGIGVCDSIISYSLTVEPIISSNCSTTPGCHVPQNFTNGDFTTYAGVKAKIDEGIFQIRVLGPNRDMPFGGPFLADSLVQQLQCWVNQGYPNN